ncbi:MAG: ATPase, partial [Candidatus Thermoplasmatota archaeon]|nr:ATPase [Candidatus Thermoplasmatota archaeon]
EISAAQELLIGNMIADEMLYRYKRYKMDDTLKEKPVVAFIIEEAPRVLSEATGIFPTIAREGRKFGIGLIAITQMCSLIPREILANMNTKIIMGTEMNSEREAVISSAPQDLSKDSRTIASLDKGEAIVSSIFSKFAVPVNVPLFEEVAKENRKEKESYRMKFVG